MSVLVEPLIPGCVPPARGTGRVLIRPDTDDWWVSWQGGFDKRKAPNTRSNECISAHCTTKEEAVAWALAQPAAEWMICHDSQVNVWEHLR
jgi:hypothetical protein